MKFDIDTVLLSHYESNLPEIPVHVLSSNKFWHVYWNLFRKPYTKWAVKVYRSPLWNTISFVIYFGIGEFVIDFR